MRCFVAPSQSYSDSNLGHLKLTDRGSAIRSTTNYQWQLFHFFKIIHYTLLQVISNQLNHCDPAQVLFFIFYFAGRWKGGGGGGEWE